MLVHVAVRAGGHRVVVMRVVTVVVGVNVLVAGRLVAVAVLVPFRGVQPHAGDHQRRRRAECDARPGRAQDERDGRTDERGRREHRRGPRRADQRLGAQVAEQAEAVADGADAGEGEGRARRGRASPATTATAADSRPPSRPFHATTDSGLRSASVRDTRLSHAHASIAAATNAAPARAGPSAPDGTADQHRAREDQRRGRERAPAQVLAETRRASSIVNGASSVSNNDVVTASVR